MSNFFGPYATPEGLCPEETNTKRVKREDCPGGIIESSVDLHTHKYPSAIHPGTRKIYVKMVRTTSWITFASYEEANPPPSLADGDVIPMPSMHNLRDNGLFQEITPGTAAAATGDATSDIAPQTGIPGHKEPAPTVDLVAALSPAANPPAAVGVPGGETVHAHAASAPSNISDKVPSVGSHHNTPLSPLSLLTDSGNEAGLSTFLDSDGPDSIFSDDSDSHGATFTPKVAAGAIVRELAAAYRARLAAENAATAADAAAEGSESSSNEDLTHLRSANQICTDITNLVSDMVETAGEVHSELTTTIDNIADALNRHPGTAGPISVQNHTAARPPYQVQVIELTSSDSDVPAAPSPKVARPTRKSRRLNPDTTTIAGPSRVQPAHSRRAAPLSPSSPAHGKGKGKGKARA